MRPRPHRIVGRVMVAGLLCCFVPALRAEVSIVHRSTNTNVGSLIISPATISEDADPIPQADIRWQVYRAVPSTAVLNLTGEVREDGSPDVVYHRLTNVPAVVWAYDNGPDHDIAFSEWTASGWSAEQFLTSDAEDELDPRLFVGQAGEVLIVWAVDGADPRVMMTSRSSVLTGWETPVRVSPPGEAARRPTVAVSHGVVRVAYERDPGTEPTGSGELVVRRLATDDSFVEEHVILVPRADRLDPVLHVGSGQLWMDWKHSNTQFGGAEYRNGSWDAPALYDWSDPSWVGAESMRLLIRRNVVVISDVVDPGF